MPCDQDSDESLQGATGIIICIDILLVIGLACGAVAADEDFVFNVLCYGAAGDGTTDDTEVQNKNNCVRILGVSFYVFLLISLNTEGVRGGVDRRVRRRGAVGDHPRAGGPDLPRWVRRVPRAMLLPKNHLQGTFITWYMMSGRND